jgi:hypothetical protein
LPEIFIPDCAGCWSAGTDAGVATLFPLTAPVRRDHIVCRLLSLNVDWVTEPFSHKQEPPHASGPLQTQAAERSQTHAADSSIPEVRTDGRNDWR